MINRVKGAWGVLIGKSAAVPAEFSREDAIAGHFSIKTSKEYVRINTQGREFFFTTNGKFDGTGTSFMKNCSPLSLVK